MTPLLLALIPPAIFAGVNHIDKYLVSRYFRSGGIGALMIFSSCIGIIVAGGIFALHPQALWIPAHTAFAISLNGALYILALLPYLYAIQREDVSNVVPLFQLTPVFSFLIEWVVLGTHMSLSQVTAGSIIILCAFMLSSEIADQGATRIKSKILILMTASSFLYAVNALLFKVFAIETPFWTTSFYEYVGFACVAILLFVLIPSYRQEFLSVFRTNKKRVLGLNGINETINIVGKISFNAISLTMPVTLVWIMGGFQPVFVFIYGIALTRMIPQHVSEDIRPHVVIKKLAIITLMTFATFFMN